MVPVGFVGVFFPRLGFLFFSFRAHASSTCMNVHGLNPLERMTGCSRQRSNTRDAVYFSSCIYRPEYLLEPGQVRNRTHEPEAFSADSEEANPWGKAALPVSIERAEACDRSVAHANEATTATMLCMPAGISRYVLKLKACTPSPHRKH
jgi:hypothetical protein